MLTNERRRKSYCDRKQALSTTQMLGCLSARLAVPLLSCSSIHLAYSIDRRRDREGPDHFKPLSAPYLLLLAIQRKARPSDA